MNALKEMSLNKVKQKARAVGISEQTITDFDDTDDPKMAAIEAILAKEKKNEQEQEQEQTDGFWTAVVNLRGVPTKNTDEALGAARLVRQECANKMVEYKKLRNSDEVAKYDALLKIIDDMERANKEVVFYCELKDFQQADTHYKDFEKLRGQLQDKLEQPSEGNLQALQVESDIFDKIKLQVQVEDIEATIEPLKNAMKDIEDQGRKEKIKREIAELEQANREATTATASGEYAAAKMHRESCHSCLLKLLRLLHPQARIDFASNRLEHASDEHRATPSGAVYASGDSDWESVTKDLEDFLEGVKKKDEEQKINVFVSGQMTQLVQKKILALKAQSKKPLVIKGSLPLFNRKNLKMMDSGNIHIPGPQPVEVTPIDIQCYGTDLNDEITDLFDAAASNLSGSVAKDKAATPRRDAEILSEAASELRFMFPVRSINEVVREKCVKKGTEFVEAVRRLGDEEPDALRRVEEFLTQVGKLEPSDFANKHYEPHQDVHAWVKEFFVRDDWRKYLKKEEFLSNFGFSQKFITKWTDPQEGVLWFDYAVRWMTKAVDIFQYPGSVADVVNLIFAMLEPTSKDSPRPLIDEVVKTVRDFKYILQKEQWHRLKWVPSCMIHDSEMDDMLAWFLVRLICSKKNQKLVCLVQLPQEVSTTLVKKAHKNDKCIRVKSRCGWKTGSKLQVTSGNDQDECVVTSVETNVEILSDEAGTAIDRVINLDRPLEYDHSKGTKVLPSKEQLFADGFLAKGATPKDVVDMQQMLEKKDRELLDHLQGQYESRNTPQSRVIPFRDPDSTNWENVSLSACLIPPQTLFIVSQHEMRAFTGKYKWNGTMFESGRKRLRLHPVTGHWCFSLDVNGMRHAYYQIVALKRLSMPHTTLGWKFLVQPENKYSEFESLVPCSMKREGPNGNCVWDICQKGLLRLNWEEPITEMGECLGVLRWCHTANGKVLVQWGGVGVKYWHEDKNDWETDGLQGLPQSQEQFQALWAASEGDIKSRLSGPPSGFGAPLPKLKFHRSDLKAEWKALNAAGDFIDAEESANERISANREVKKKLKDDVKPIFSVWIPPAHSPDTPPFCQRLERGDAFMRCMREATCDAFTRCRQHSRQTENHYKSCLECRTYQQALAFLNELGIETWIDHKWDRCYCSKCFTAPGDLIEKDEHDYKQIAPRGWVGFGVVVSRYLRSDALGQVDVEKDDVACESWPIKFHGCNPNSLPDILRHGNIARPGDRLINNMSMAAKLRREEQSPIFFTSPTVAYAGLQYYARPKPIDAIPGKFGQVVLQCNQQDSSLLREDDSWDGDETLGFSQVRLAVPDSDRLEKFPDHGVCNHVSLYAKGGKGIETFSKEPAKCRIRRVLIRTFQAPPTDNELEPQKRKGTDYIRHFVHPLSQHCETFRCPIDCPKGTETDDGTVWL